MKRQRRGVESGHEDVSKKPCTGLRAPAHAIWPWLFGVFGVATLAQGASELEAWEHIKSSHQGAVNARACSDYRRFVETSPQGRLVPLVRDRFLVQCGSGHSQGPPRDRAPRTVPVTAPPSTRIGPHARYIDHRDGTVTDAVTGLTWMRCAVGQFWTGRTCQGRATRIGWAAAAAYSMRFARHADWRLPGIDELATLVYCSNGRPDDYTNGRNASDQASDWGCYGEPAKDHARPTLAPGVFPNNPASLYWSGSRDAPLPGPNGVYFGYGSLSNTNTTGVTHIRMVRGGAGAPGEPLP